jgi:ATP-binding protein involved in chromosome partitioning
MDSKAKACGGQKMFMPMVKNIIAIASGKGGVGKSTTAVNLALSFQQQGLKTGILDADIYGPSIPHLFNLSGKPESDGKRIEPKEYKGLKTMSIGYMVPKDNAIIWRGLMVTNALKQLLMHVNWGELDLLIIDLPPGTGDAQLTLVQQVNLTGAIIVSTPQDLALIDARKAINMFQKVNVPIIGVIENMSHFKCTNCDARHEIFARGGARKEAEAHNVPILGEIPLHVDIREQSDKGEPIVEAQPDSEIAKSYREIAKQCKPSLKP